LNNIKVNESIFVSNEKGLNKRKKPETNCYWSRNNWQRSSN